MRPCLSPPTIHPRVAAGDGLGFWIDHGLDWRQSDAGRLDAAEADSLARGYRTALASIGGRGSGHPRSASNQEHFGSTKAQLLTFQKGAYRMLGESNETEKHCALKADADFLPVTTDTQSRMEGDFQPAYGLVHPALSRRHQGERPSIPSERASRCASISLRGDGLHVRRPHDVRRHGHDRDGQRHGRVGQVSDSRAGVRDFTTKPTQRGIRDYPFTHSIWARPRARVTGSYMGYGVSSNDETPIELGN
jgi:hypothetical protein